MLDKLHLPPHLYSVTTPAKHTPSLLWWLQYLKNRMWTLDRPDMWLPNSSDLNPMVMLQRCSSRDSSLGLETQISKSWSRLDTSSLGLLSLEPRSRSRDSSLETSQDSNFKVSVSARYLESRSQSQASVLRLKSRASVSVLSLKSRASVSVSSLNLGLELFLTTLK